MLLLIDIFCSLFAHLDVQDTGRLVYANFFSQCFYKTKRQLFPAISRMLRSLSTSNMCDSSTIFTPIKEL